MNKRLVFHLSSLIVAIVGVAMFVSGCVSWVMKDTLSDILGFFACSIFTLLAASVMVYFTRIRNEQERRSGIREGFAIVSFAWFAASIFGMLPYIVVSDFYWYDALFETVSGFSTTGATLIDPELQLMHNSVLPNGIDSLPYGLLFWRSLTQWLGGMGIVILSIAILPLLKIGGQALYNAETTGVKSMESQIAPRIASSAKILWVVYVFLTLCELVLLWLSGMTFFDSVCHSFTTISTGGFSTKQASIAYYQNDLIHWIILVFMFLSGCNFTLHYHAFTGKPLRYFKDDEFRFYFMLVISAILLISAVLTFTPGIQDSISHTEYYMSPLKAVQYASFQVVSLITSTGYATGNYAAWPTFAGIILFFFLFTGACGGSTSGGMKCVRPLILWRHGIMELRRCIFPRSITDVRLNGVRVEWTTLQKTLAFVTLFLAMSFFFLLLLTLSCDMDILTAASASITCLSNIGPGFGRIGPEYSFSWMNSAAKLLLAVEMLLGRLELYTVLVLFLPSFWKK